MGLDTHLHIADLSLRPIVTIGPDEALRTAAQVMRTSNVSALVVNQPDTPVSILTERDLARAVAAGVDPATPVATMASPRPFTVPTDATAIDAATRMLCDGVRHLVVTHDNHAIGIVSIRDLLGALIQTLSPDAAHLMIRQVWCDMPENWLG
jgi:CBS domain-containing protein